MVRVRIRDGVSRDHDAAAALWRSAHGARASNALRWGRNRTLRGYLARQDAFFVVAEDEDEFVGMALGMQGLEEDGAGPPIPGLCHISAVFVAPERWGEGIGRELVHAILVRARERGYGRSQLWTQADNERARRLYEGIGFVRSGREKEHKNEWIVHYELGL